MLIATKENVRVHGCFRSFSGGVPEPGCANSFFHRCRTVVSDGYHIYRAKNMLQARDSPFMAPPARPRRKAGRGNGGSTRARRLRTSCGAGESRSSVI